MRLLRPAARRSMVARGLAALALLAAGAALAAEVFPFDREMVLDAPRIGGLRRMPLLVVEEGGSAVLKLWCKDVRARVEVSDAAIRVEAAALPDALPAYMIDGQCSAERMQADTDLLAAITQVTGWQRRGDRLLLGGPTPLRFFASSH